MSFGFRPDQTTPTLFCVAIGLAGRRRCPVFLHHTEVEVEL